VQHPNEGVYLQATGAKRLAAIEKADMLVLRGLQVFNGGDPHQAERIQQLAAAQLAAAGVRGLPAAHVLSGLADIVFQSDKRRLPEAVEHLREAAEVSGRVTIRFCLVIVRSELGTGT